jgi:surfeit locus 1 family protein
MTCSFILFYVELDGGMGMIGGVIFERFPMGSRLSLLLAFVLCGTPLGLGTWQVYRLMWKQDLIQTLEHESKNPPVPIPLNPKNFQKVTVSGELIGSPLKLMQPRAGKPFGSTQVQGFKTSEGFIILVEGGKASFYTVRVPPKPNWFTPSNSPLKNQWYWMDLKAMGQALNLPVETHYYLSSGAFNPKLSNRHLEYAVTWYIFGIIGFLIFYRYFKKSRRKDSNLLNS